MALLHLALILLSSWVTSDWGKCRPGLDPGAEDSDASNCAIRESQKHAFWDRGSARDNSSLSTSKGITTLIS